MRQATGSNTPQAGNKVSIQRSLDGHSFSVPALSELPAGEAPVTVELLLPRTMLVPGELFDEKHAAEMLAANGMPPTADECAVCCGPEAEFAAVTAINREILRQVEEKLGDRARFTTPLLHTPHDAAKTVWMSRRAGLLYIKVYDGGELQLAEAIPAATDTDAAYFFERLDGCFPLKGSNSASRATTPKAVANCWANVSNKRHANSKRKIQRPGDQPAPETCVRGRRPISPRRTSSTYWAIWWISRSATCSTFSPAPGRSATNSHRAGRGASRRSRSTPCITISSGKPPHSWGSGTSTLSRPMFSST